MADDPYKFASGVSAPATSFVAVTPSDGTPLAVIPKALFVGAAGDVALKSMDAPAGATVIFKAAAGSILPVRCSYVLATGTTATSIVALY